ncbi:MAG: phosphoribosylglycinamide formyltransferase [Alphaproteobacteria bacterium]|nr:phosphoribosylglycinamide formyltransferase [Alphaproteobacteria bacterium]
MARLKTAVLISGRGSNLQALLDACAEPAFPAEIALVVSNVAGAYGLTRAERAGVPTLVIDHKGFDGRAAFDRAVDQAIRAAGCEAVCLAGFMRLLTPDFVAGWHGRMLNVHPSLLPAFKGLHTHERALEAGVRLHGCSVHFVTADLDAGPIVAQAAVPVLRGDTPDDLGARVLVQEHRIYPLALRLLAEGRLRLSGGVVEIDNAGRAPEAALVNPLP